MQIKGTNFFLFICLEGLSSFIILYDRLRGMGTYMRFLSIGGPKLTHLFSFFAYNSLLFSRVTTMEGQMTQNILKEYKEALGQ